MFVLMDADGEFVKMKNGRPFVYTTRWTAKLGKLFLEAIRKDGYKIVSKG